MSSNGENVLPGKADHGIMRMKFLKSDASALVFQRDKAFMPDDGIRITELRNQRLKNPEGFRGKADMHFLGVNTADGFQPGRTSFIICDQLRFIDYRHFKMF